jgi:mannose-6-phosphate isomerase
MTKESRPWGWYTVLKVDAGYKLKEIVVRPSQRLSYQSHFQRRESWTITEGYAKITLDGVEKLYTTGDTVIIDFGVKHRVQNASEIHNLTFIEVQTGSYFGEDDIVRYEDDYGRIN